MTTLICYDLHGHQHPVAVDDLIFRPAAYGIFIENNHILLAQNKTTQLWHPPGGVLESGATPIQSIRQSFTQIVGTVPHIGSLVFVEDQYLYQDNQGWHLSAMYHALYRPTASTTSLFETADETKWAWFEVTELQREQLQFGYEAIKAGHLYLKLQTH